jgi:ribosome-associated protein
MNSEQLKQHIINTLDDLKGKEINSLDVRNKTSVTDILVIVSGNSVRQVKALANNVVEKLKEHGVKPLSMEGEGSSGWVLVDYGDVILHVMLPETRDYYNLEKLWGEDAPDDDSVTS